MARDSLASVIILFVLVALVVTSFSEASSQVSVQATGIVSINIINQPPTIHSIETPEELFSDSMASCTPEIRDEYPDTVLLDYKWFINERPVSEEPTLNLANHNVLPDDKITCTIIPIDSAKQKGIPAAASLAVSKTPLKIIASKTALSIMGISANSDKISELNNEGGFAAITGFAVAETKTQNGENILSLVIVVLAIFFLLNLRGYLKARMRKSHHLRHQR